MSEFGHALLAAIQRKNISALEPLESVVREALGLPEKQKPVAPVISQTKVPSEFPQVRVKYDSSGNEVARRVVNSLDELSRISREEPLIFGWLASPLVTEKE